MCFGMQTTGEKTSTSTPNPAVVAQGATGNIDFVKGLQNQGFTPYSGQQVADLSPQQQSSIRLTNAIANNGTARCRPGR
jgi:hypothetical protein